MDNIINKKKSPWIRPWHITKFNDIYNRDERFFAIVIKGLISWLNRNVIMYNKSINHFIFNTGSSYMYVESNGYELSFNETTGEDWMYMELPRCVLELQGISIPTEELSSPFARGNYERKDGDNIRGFNSEIRRLPIEISVDLKYVFSNFNESIILLQELIEKLVFQKYFNITYLGQIIKCSIEFPQDYNIEVNKIDMTSTDVNQRNLNLNIKICTNYPVINDRSEVSTANVISSFGGTLTDINDNDTGVIPSIDPIIDNTELSSTISLSIGDIFVNLKDYDFNNDNQITDDEIYFIKDLFINLDINNDGVIDKDDIMEILNIYKNDLYNINLDMNQDGVVDKDDILKIIHYLKILDVDRNGIIDQNDIDNIINAINEYIEYNHIFDINKDLIIDQNDIDIIIDTINNHQYNSDYDFNHDGKVNQDDLNILIDYIESNTTENINNNKTYYNQIILYLNNKINKNEAISDIHKYLYR